MSVQREIEALVRRVAREEIARARTSDGHHPWLTVEEYAARRRTTPAAVR